MADEFVADFQLLLPRHVLDIDGLKPLAGTAASDIHSGSRKPFGYHSTRTSVLPANVERLATISHRNELRSRKLQSSRM